MENKNKINKLIIIDKGDSSVGIDNQYWECEVPFYIEDYNEISFGEQESLDYFKEQMIKVYQEFSEGKVSAYYDYEFIKTDII